MAITLSCPRRFWSSRPVLAALLVSTGCVVAGFMMMGLALFPLSHALDEIFSGTGSALSTSMIFLGVVVCNIVAWAPATRFVQICCVAGGAVSLVGLPATAIALVRCGERRSLRADFAAAATTIIGVTGVTAVMSWSIGAGLTAGTLAWGLGFSAVLSAGCLLLGRVRGTRAALVVSLREHARAAERAAVAERLGRDADVARVLAEERSSFAEERSALARDMHDGISHRLSVVTLHAGAMSSRSDLSPEQMRAAALTVRDAAEGTGVMLREALTALRGVPDGAAGPERDGGLTHLSRGEASQIDSSQIDSSQGDASRSDASRGEASLAARVAGAEAQGLQVALRWWGLTQVELDAAPERADALARITDEVLMNAIKYAPEQPLAIDVSVQEGQLRLLARNPLQRQRALGAKGAEVVNGIERANDTPHAIGTGFGLVGVAERAALVGGGARSGETVDAHFQVDVWIPWT